MATSLARQLAALRTPSTTALSATSYYSGPFLFTEADQENCDMVTLKERMKSSIIQLIETEPFLNEFYDFLVLQRLDHHTEKETIEDLLFVISPYLLLKPAQWVLQFLVIEHKVNYKYPELFFFCVLPFYEYDIYAKSLLAIDTIPGGSDYPNWLIKFKAQCAPTTKLALYRHTASDKGFLKLLTDMMIKLIRMTVKFPDLRIQRQTSMFTMTVLGGLENKDKITEEQTLYTLQVIFKAMKSNHTELIAMSQILLSYILPKMAFKEKVVAKMLKALKNCVKKKATMECIMVLIMIVRTQPSLDIEKAWPIINSMEVLINEALSLIEDTEMVHNLDDILYTLTLLLQPAVPKGKKAKFPSCPAAVNKMIGISSHIISSVNISSETAIFIGDTVCSLLRCMRNTTDADVVDADSVEKAKDHAEHIIKQINARYPEVYQQIVVDTEDIDLFFIGGSKGTGLSKKPEQSLVSAKKVLLNNSLVNVIKEQLISININLKVQEAWKKNRKDIKAFLSVDTEYLIYNLPGLEFQNVMLNILNFSQEEEIVNLVLGHLCHQLVWKDTKKANKMEVDGDNTEVNGKETAAEEKRVFKLRLEMALLTFFCQENAGSRKIVTNSYFAIHSDLVSCLALISDEHPDKRVAVIDKLKPMMSSEVAKSFMEDSFLWENLRIMSLMLPAFKEKINWNQVKIEKHDLIRFIAKLMLNNPNMEDAQTEGVILEMLGFANVTTTVEDGVVIMECLPDLIERKAKKFVVAIEQLIESRMKDEEDILRFYLGCGAKTKCLRTKYLILSPVINLLDNKEFIDKLLEPSTNIFPLLISLVLNEELLVRKHGFAIIRKLKKVSDGQKYNSIVQFLATNRNELTADLSSLTSMLKKAELEPESTQCLLQSTTRCDPMITQILMPFFTTVKSTEAIKDLSAFGSDLIKSGINDDSLASIIKKFHKRIIKNMGEESCRNFFFASLKCGRVVTVAGIQLRISDVMLDNVTAPKLWAGIEEDVLIRILEGAVGLSSESANEKLISMLCMTKISVEMFITMFNSVWGENNLKSKSRGKSESFSEQNSGLDEAQLKIWGKTVFLLELLDSYLPTETCDVGWQTIVPKIFAVFRKLSNDDVMESSYKLNLILTVLLKMFNILSDARIKELKQGDLEAELLTYCIRRSANPESRQLALKVLARCSVTIPEYVMQNSMTIFTFMGTHLLKMDSKHSYEIACEAIDVIIPAMKSTSTSKQELKNISLEMLNNFIHMDEDVPEHRYSEFVFRLIKALDAETYLWVAMLLCIKSTFKSKHRATRTSLIHRRLTELIQRFTLPEALRGIIGLFVNMRGDAPMLRKIFGCSMDRREDKDKADEWDVLRLGGLLLITKLVSSTDLVARVGKELLVNSAEIRDLLHMLLESSFLTLECFTDLPKSTPEKLKTSILDQGEKCLQLVLALLPYKLYISIVAELLASPNSTLRRRAMEVVVSKLDCVDADVDLSSDAAMLLPALTQLCINETQPENQQMAFLSLRQISKQVKVGALLNSTLATLNTKFLETVVNPGVLGAAILTLTDILLAAGVQGISHLDANVKWFVKTIKSIPDKKWEEKYEKVVYTSLLLALQKIVEKFGGFLNPHIDKIVKLSCRLYSHPVASIRARELWNSLATNLSPHVLLPRAKELLEMVWDEPSTVAKLSGLVGLNSKKLERGQLNSMENQIIQYFSKAFSYREEHPVSDQVNAAESEVIEGFLTLAMKMCLDDFKPMFNKLVEKLKTGGDASYVTLFNFTERISNSLKNLFGFGLEFVLLESTTTLNKEICSNDCAEAVLRCLSKVVMYNKITELPQDVYENLVSAIFPLYQRDASLHQIIQDALVGLVDSTENDVYWKHLNFCTLMELRNSDAAVRIQILRVVKRYVTLTKETYLVVLPDAVPFLTESLEDDDQDVENECRDLIQHMETVFGQDIQDYFS